MTKLALCLALVACGGTARGLDTYRTDTQKLLETRGAALQSCYDDALKTDATLTGKVTIKFVVAKKTGAIASTTVDPSNVLGQCVLKAVAGLKLDPPDRNEGRATFVYEFKPSAS